jgi:hypothetical protein
VLENVSSRWAGDFSTIQGLFAGNSFLPYLTGSIAGACTGLGKDFFLDMIPKSRQQNPKLTNEILLNTIGLHT